MTTKKAIRVCALSKEFGPIQAVQNLSFEVAYGEVLGFLGPNGAGKSTTMKMITGFLEPSNGTVFVDQYAVQDDPIAVKHAIGYLPEGAPTYGEMSVYRFLDFIAEIRGIRGTEKRLAVERAIDTINLGSVAYQAIETLSKGYKRRVGLAQCILHNPQILIMDEPTDGLDPNQKHEVRSLIKQMAKENKAIIISTHILEEVDTVCSRAIIIASGQILFNGTPEQLAQRSKNNNIDEAFRHITLPPSETNTPS